MGERDQLAAEIDSLTRQIATMGHELSPVYQRDASIRDRISETHGGPGKFNREGAPQRKPLFEVLTQIAVQHGPKKQLLKDMKRRVSAYSKELIRLDKEAAQAKAKPPRRNMQGARHA